MSPRNRPESSTAEPPSTASLYRLPDAARLMGISRPTLKQWIYRGRIKSVRTPGGHHRIPRSEVDRICGDRRGATLSPTAQALEAVSGRNKLLGTITHVRISGLLAEVILAVGKEQLTAIITSASARALGLKPGMSAYGLVKATEVMIVRA